MARYEWQSEDHETSPARAAIRMIRSAQMVKERYDFGERETRAAIADAAGAHASAVQLARRLRAEALGTYEQEAARSLLLQNFPLQEPQASVLRALYEAGMSGTELLDHADESGCGWQIDAYGCWLELPVEGDDGTDSNWVNFTVSALERF